MQTKIRDPDRVTAPRCASIDVEEAVGTRSDFWIVAIRAAIHRLPLPDAADPKEKFDLTLPA